MDRKRAGAQSGGARGGFQIVDLRGFPNDGGEAVLDDRRSLTGKDTGHDHDAVIRTERARGDAFFNAGDADPVGTRVHDGWSAEGEGVTVGVSLDDGEEFHVGCRQTLKKAEVVFEGAGSNLNPAWAHLHLDILCASLRHREGRTGAENVVGMRAGSDRLGT